MDVEPFVAGTASHQSLLEARWNLRVCTKALLGFLVIFRLLRYLGSMPSVGPDMHLSEVLYAQVFTSCWSPFVTSSSSLLP